ncbi:GNAT family N-acetyltransferase [Paracoccus litorisediminis]|uniref:GNAT family N-acetyltransferase n=1 Tax=Paracoccus litorisediminis TaxID=2006130 RepID=UPI003731699F
MGPTEFFGIDFDETGSILAGYHLSIPDEQTEPLQARGEGDPFNMVAAFDIGEHLEDDTFYWTAARIEEGAAVAVASVVETMHLDGSYSLWLDKIFVSPGYRGQGQATRLVSALVDIYAARLKRVDVYLRGRCEIACEAASPGGEAIRARLARETERLRHGVEALEPEPAF